MQLTRAILPTPLGDMLALASDTGLCALEFTGPKRLTRLERRLAKWFPPHEVVDDVVASGGRSPVIDRTRAWLDRYFAGASADVDIPLDMRGAEFERRVWKALLKIPAGATTSYGAIAKSLGSAGASRAVGLANGSNPVAIIVPCHRVLAAGTSLGGFSAPGGASTKAALLAAEGVLHGEQASLF